MRYLVGFILTLNVVLSQKLVPRYWNSLSTHVTVGVPLVEDESLIGGKIQLKVSFDNGNTFSELGEQSIIDNDDQIHEINNSNDFLKYRSLRNAKNKY